ncbi:MAG: AAA family ATPase [Patescibacteria group bacterium]
MFDSQKLIWFGIALIAAAMIYFVQKKGGLSFISKMKSGGGNTPFLSLYTVDFTKMARDGKLDPVVGREEEVRKLTQILARRGKNNAILIGEPGVGKTAIVEGFANLIAKGEIPDTLKDKRVLALDVAGLLSGTKYRGEFENRAKKIVQEISDSHRSIILFIDEVQSVVQSQGSEGSINFSDILKPALARGDLQMIGATTINEYEKYIKTDLSLERRFQPVEVDEPNEAETLTIMAGIKDRYREYHKVEFTDAALKASVELTKKMINDRKLPDKAIDAIDEAAAMVRVSHLHGAVSALLYQAAATKYPNVQSLWKQIQDIDSKISQSTGAEKESAIKQREDLEKNLLAEGLSIVDSSDIEKIVTEWAK